MPITITSPAATSRIGPGLGVCWTISAGPIPNDDYVEIRITETASGTSYKASTLLTNGGLNGCNMIGEYGVFPGPSGVSAIGMVDARAISAVARHLHASGSLVQTSASVNYVWDAVSGLWLLEARREFNGSSVLTEILDAVQHTFPATS